ncbi:histonelysine Nmethyltransferase SETMARlike [Trichonephila clavipes]|nr:histonelysine Nmethyltransferase SETMARlike [Trichonephila clavipes]
MNGVYDADIITANYVQFWFHRFCSGIFDVKDAPRTRRPIVENADKISEIIEVHRHVSSRSTVQVLKIVHKTVLNHLRKVGFKKKLDRGEAGTKPGLRAKRGLYCVFGGPRSLLPLRPTLNSDLYCQQLDRWKLAMDQNWPTEEVLKFHPDNARLHTSVVSHQKLWELD